MNKIKTITSNIVSENILKIKELFPNCVIETKDKNGNTTLKIDFETLKQELSDDVIKDDIIKNNEKYEFTWPGKNKSILLANQPTDNTLRPCKDESVNWDTTQNLYIEGDNLEVLKILRSTYFHKVKLIYIDPPYNTGKDFIYKDNYKKNEKEHLCETNQIDEDGNRLVQNKETNGRFHTDWLNMMYPRLKLARDFLADNGVIFISIDDREVHNLKKICDDIFGEENFILQFIWEKTQHFGRQKINYYSNCEYILCYTTKLFIGGGLNELLIEYTKTNFMDAPLYNASNKTNKILFPKKSVKFNIEDGKYQNSNNNKFQLLNTVIVKNQTNINDFIINFKSRWSQKKIFEEYEKGTRYLIKSSDFSVRAIYANDKTFNESPKQIIFTNINNNLVAKNKHGRKVGTTEEGSSILKKLKLDYFKYPKPVSVINYLISLLSDKDNIILDFFSGSATTAHAVMQLNAEDGGNRKFIMVQLPESCNEKSEAFKAGYKNICEIGKERIRRAGKKIIEETGKTNLDVGFRVLKLDSSNMKETHYLPEEYNSSLIENNKLYENIKKDRTPEDLLIQSMLEFNILLSSPIKEEFLEGKRFFNVNNDELICYFEDNLTDDLVEKILYDHKNLKYFVTRDSAVDDNVLTNVEPIIKIYNPNLKWKVI